MSDGANAAGVLEQVQNARRKKKIESLKAKLSNMLDDREKAEKALADIDQSILDALTDEGLTDAASVAEVLG